MSKIIVVGQNEVARLPKDTDSKLATIGLFDCICAVLRGANGITIAHINVHTDLQFLIEELKNLGPDSSIKLFKKFDSEPDLVQKIINHLNSKGIPIKYANVIQITPVKPLPFGVVVADSTSSDQPNKQLCYQLASPITTDADADIDTGPQNIQMRSYIQQIWGYLNPDLEHHPTVIYADDSWQDAFELSKNDKNLLKWLFYGKTDAKDAIFDPKAMRLRILQMLANNNKGYVEKFGPEYARYKAGNPLTKYVYETLFPELLDRIHAYIKKNDLLIDSEIPKIRKSPAKKPLGPGS